MTSTQFPRLLKVTALAKPNGDTVYTGLFADGIKRTLRTSHRDYVSVAQVIYPERAPRGSFLGNSASEDFIFSAKLTPILSPYQRSLNPVIVPIGVGSPQ